MATYFGRASSSRTYFAKVRWVIGCMLSLIMLLTASLVYVSMAEDEIETPIDVAQAAASPLSTIEVLISKQRIESGQQLEAYMFQPTVLLEDQVTQDTILASRQGSVMGKYAKRMIPAGSPLSSYGVADSRPIETLPIPPGYRATTISADARELVEGFVTPNSRVDVIWNFNGRGGKTVLTLVNAAKVLSVAGHRNAQGKVNVGSRAHATLLVSEEDAMKIELARSTGSLSLLLRGIRGGITPASGSPKRITLASILNQGGEGTEIVEPAVDGTLYTSDPNTGRTVRYILTNGRWKRDRKFS